MGAAAVEFAFVCPILFLIIFGLIEFGRIWMVQGMLGEAARRACHAAVSVQSLEVTAAGYTNWDSYINDKYVTPFLSTYGISAEVETYYVNDGLVTNIGPNLTSAQGNGTGYTPGSEVTVLVRVQYSKISWTPTFYIPLAGVGTAGDYMNGGNSYLQGQYTLRRE
jgi:Flp pilus assembly protein TadG